MIQHLSLSSSCWFYCSAGAAVTTGGDEGRCHFSHWCDAKNPEYTDRVVMSGEKMHEAVPDEAPSVYARTQGAHVNAQLCHGTARKSTSKIGARVSPSFSVTAVHSAGGGEVARYIGRHGAKQRNSQKRAVDQPSNTRGG